jgi:chromosome segregation ATPase
MGFFDKIFGVIHKKCKSQAKQLEDSILELQREIKLAELDYKSEKLDLESAISKLYSDYTTLEDHNKVLASSNKELHESKQEFDKKLLLETEKIKGLETLLERKKNIIQEKENVIKGREEELILYEGRFQDIEQKVDETCKKLADAENKYNALQTNYQNALKNAGQNKLQFELKQKESKQDYDKKLYALQIQLSREYERQYGAKCVQLTQKYFKVYFSLRHWHPTVDIMHPMQRAFSQLGATDKQDLFLGKLENACRNGADSVKDVFAEYGQEMKQINSRHQDQNGGQGQDQNSRR